MRLVRRRLVLGGLGLVVVAIVVALPWRIVARRPPPPPPAPVSRVAAVSGRVVAPDGTPIARARVSLIEYRDDEGREGASVTTDATGAFRFPRVEWHHDEGPPAVAAQGAGWAVVYHQAPYSGKPVVLTPSRPSPLRVAFQDAAGRPLRGLPVTVQQVIIRGGSGSFLLPRTWRDQWAQRTDARGLVTFPSLPQRVLVRLVTPDERFAQIGDAGWVDRAGKDAATVGPITMIPGGVISGTVRYGPTGKAAAGIMVGAGQTEESGLGGGQAVTDRRGRYRITQLPPGNYNVALGLRDGLDRDWTAVAQTAIAVDEGESAEEVDFTLIKGAVLTGRVTGTDTHKGIPGVLVEIYGPAHPENTSWVQRAETDTDGRYWTRVPPGGQRVYLQAPLGYTNPKGAKQTTDAIERRVQAKDGKAYTVSFRFAGPVRPIHGRVLDSRHRPVPGADVVVVRVASNAEVERRFGTDAKGEFSLPAEAVFLRAVRGNAATVKAKKVTLDGEVTLVLKEGVLGAASGLVVDPAQKPLAGVKVELRAVPERGWADPQAPPAATVITGGDGRYLFPALWPNRHYEVAVRVTSQASVGREFTLKPGQRLAVAPTTVPAAPPPAPPAP